MISLGVLLETFNSWYLDILYGISKYSLVIV